MPGDGTGGHPKQRLNLHITNAEDDTSPLSWDERGASEASGGMREAGKGKMVANHRTPFLGRQSSISSTGNAGGRDGRTPRRTPEPPQNNAEDDTSPLSWDERGASEASGVCGRRGRARWSQITARRSSDVSHQSCQRGMPGAGTGKTTNTEKYNQKCGNLRPPLNNQLVEPSKRRPIV